MDLTPDGLVTLMGFALSLIFAYFPMVRQWFDELDAQYKPLVNAVFLFALALGKLAVDTQLNYDLMLANWQRLFVVWFYALIVNQTTFTVGVKQFKQAEWEKQYIADLPDQTDQP